MTNCILKALAANLFACAMIVFFAAGHVSAQEAGVIDVAKVPVTAANLNGFVPAGWKIEEKIDGDLNGDGIADHALKLIEDKPATNKDDTVNDRGRALVLVFEDKDGKFRNAAVADKLLQCSSCGGAFYGVSPAPANVTIQKGVLVVEQDHGSRDVTDVTFRFRYDEQPNMFILIGFDYSSRDRAAGGGASESTNYLTGKRVSTKSKGKRDTTTTSQVKKMRYSIQEVDADKFEEEASTRLGLD